MASSIEQVLVPIEPDDDASDITPAFVAHWPKRPPSQHHPPLDLSQLSPSAYTKNLKDLDRDELIQRLYSFEVSKSSIDVLAGNVADMSRHVGTT
jgi:hypothetical protein